MSGRKSQGRWPGSDATPGEEQIQSSASKIFAVCAAIERRQVLKFVYRGGIRRVEPYCYGLTDAGDEVLLAVQRSGYSASRDEQVWRLFHLASMEGLAATEHRFEEVPDEWNPENPHPAITEIRCQLE